MKIQVYFREVYGRRLAYPANDLAKALAKLMRLKTFSDTQLAEIAEHFSVEVVPAPENFPTFDKQT